MNEASSSDPDDDLVDELCDYQNRLVCGDVNPQSPDKSTEESYHGRPELAGYLRCIAFLNETCRDLQQSSEQAPVEDNELHESISGYRVPSRIGRFQIVDAPVVGGFGLVFRARDPLIERDVAIKVPKPEHLASEHFVERFVREARVCALLDHPNIVPVLESSFSGVTPYIVMPFVEGPTLASWRRNEVSVSARAIAEIVQQLALGITHAHKMGVLHRDIKPGNILLATPPAESNAGGLSFIPQLTDFGLAKLHGVVPEQTRTGTVMGTAGYMAPEQLEPGSQVIGPEADVYGLGAVLYFLLTTASPSDMTRSGLSEVQLPHRITSRNDETGEIIPLDLAMICRKCLDLAPGGRYSSARDLVEDLRRFQNGETISARHASVVTRVLKWTRRYPAWALLVFVSLFSVLALTGTSLVYSSKLAGLLQQSEVARKTLLDQERMARQRAYVADMALAGRCWSSNRIGQMLPILDRYRPKPGEVDLRDFVWWFLWREYSETSRVIGRHEGGATTVAMTKDGAMGASGGLDGVIRIWSLPDRKLQRELQPTTQKPIRSLDFNPAGDRLVSGSDDGTIRVWEIPTGNELYVRSDHGSPVLCVAFSPEGEMIASGGVDQVIRLWDAASGELRGQLNGHTNDVAGIAFHPDAVTLASSSRDKTVRLWNLPKNIPDSRIPDGVLPLGPLSGWPRSITISADGTQLIAAHLHQSLNIWSLNSDSFGEETPPPTSWPKLKENIRAMLQLKSGFVVTATTSIQISSFRDNYQWELRGCTDSILGLASDEDGRALLSGSTDGEVRYWSILGITDSIFHPSPAGSRSISAESCFSGLDFSNHQCASMDSSPMRHKTINLFQLSDGRNIGSFPVDDGCQSYVISPDSSFVILATTDRNIHRLDTHDGQIRWKTELPSRVNHQVPFQAVSKDASFIAVANGHELVIVSAADGQVVYRLLHPSLVTEVQFWDRPGASSRLVSGCRDGICRIWSIDTGELLREQFVHTGSINSLDISADQQLLAAAAGRTVSIRRLDDLQEVARLNLAVNRLKFFGNADHLVCWGDGTTILSVNEMAERLSFSVENQPDGFAVSPDGRTLGLNFGNRVRLIRDKLEPN